MDNNLTGASITGLSNLLASATTQVNPASFISNATQSTGLSIPDPIGAAIKNALRSISNITNVIVSRIKGLEEDIVKSVSNTGKVELINNVIVVTLQPKDAPLIPSYEAKIQKDITSITSSLTKMQTLLNTLSTISHTATTLKSVLDIQEALIASNPISKATMEIVKKAIRILSYKDILSDYINIIENSLTSNEQTLRQLIGEVKLLNVRFTVSNAANNGDNINTNQALDSIASSSLADSSIIIGQSVPYTTVSGKGYNLTVEPYGNGELVARARDKFSGGLVVETSPSYIKKPEDLITEIKAIIGD